MDGATDVAMDDCEFLLIRDIYTSAMFMRTCRGTSRYRALDPSAIEDRRSVSGEHNAAHATSRE